MRVSIKKLRQRGARTEKEYTDELEQHGRDCGGHIAGLCWRWRWWWLGSAGDESASDDRCREGEECVFHSVMFVVFVIVFIDTLIAPENY